MENLRLGLDISEFQIAWCYFNLSIMEIQSDWRWFSKCNWRSILNGWVFSNVVRTWGSSQDKSRSNQL